ncbi:sugar phosphate isomerase/epimerase [Candidatus Woesearchaeota archaeon]|nr:sugar phosphate isomerase/epimerase [Candidatus Woesearchaeota archaeon]
MVGISSKNCQTKGQWLESLLKKGFKLVEINHRWTSLPFDDQSIKRKKDILKKYSAIVTIHSGTSDLLHKNRLIYQQQRLLLKAEIIFANKIKAKTVSFHFPKYLDHKKDKNMIHKFLKEILSFAKKYKIPLLIENDSNGPWTTAEDFLPYLKKYKSLKFLLDIGHLNRSTKAGLVSSEKEFIEKMKPYIRYVHVHSNKGIYDDHIALGDGNIKKEIILPLLKKLKIKYWIVETDLMKNALKTRQVLKKFGIK